MHDKNQNRKELKERMCLKKKKKTSSDYKDRTSPVNISSFPAASVLCTFLKCKKEIFIAAKPIIYRCSSTCQSGELWTAKKGSRQTKNKKTERKRRGETGGLRGMMTPSKTTTTTTRSSSKTKTTSSAERPPLLLLSLTAPGLFTVNINTVIKMA